MAPAEKGARLAGTLVPAGIVIRGALVLDDQVVLVRPDGTTTPAVPGGHARPSGWSSDPAATRRR
jgi:hypothetical protein